MQISRSNVALFPAYIPTSECDYADKPTNFKEKMAEILKKEGKEEVILQKRMTRSQSKKKEESKKVAEEESEEEEDFELNQITDHYQRNTMGCFDWVVIFHVDKISRFRVTVPY